MTAKKCDRCGKLYEEYTSLNGVATIHNPMDPEKNQHDGFTFKKAYDLCPDCMEEFQRWISGGMI